MSTADGWENMAERWDETGGEAGDTWPDASFLEQIPLHCIIDARRMNGS